MKKSLYISCIIFPTLLSFMFLSSEVLAQDTSQEEGFLSAISPEEVYTDMQTVAVGLLIDYSENPQADLTTSPPTSDSSWWLLDISPDIKAQTGANDVFNGLVIKLSGNFIKFYLAEIAE